MYNNILRKITSLSLLTILLTSTGAFVMPNALPAAHASSNANLFVSVENSQYNNYFAGPQVVQVIVSDPDINRLDQAYGEPTVTVNGKKLRMAQNTDGNWYGYFADSKQAQIADSTAPLAGKGLNFGELCSATSAATATGVSFAETKGVFIATHAPGSVNGTQNPSATVGNTCTGPAAAVAVPEEHVIRENKTLTKAPATGSITGLGQINFAVGTVWPVIQLYDFGNFPQAVTVQYQKAGGVQSTTLTFDRIPVNLISTSADRTAYPKNSMVFINMNDPQLNIDPTEEDSWTWGSSAANNTVFYQAFDRNGKVDADGTVAMQNLIGNLTAFMFNHNGKFTVTPAVGGIRVIDFQSNGKQILNASFVGGIPQANTFRSNPANVTTQSIGKGSQPITFIESGGVNTGVFQNWDGGKKSNIITVNNNSIRGQQASFRYNDIGTSIVGGFTFGSISMTATNGTWTGGVRIPVTLTDPDANLNSKITEHLNAYDPSVKRLATEKIGTPFSLNAANSILYPAGPETAFFVNGTSFANALGGASGNRTVSLNSTAGAKLFAAVNNAQDEGFSNRPLFAPANQVNFTSQSNGAIVVDYGVTMQTLRNTIHNTNTTAAGNPENFKGFNSFTLDVRSLSTLTNVTGSSSVSNVQVYLLYNHTAKTAGGTILNGTGGLVSGLNAISIINSTNEQAFVNLNVTSANVANPAGLNHNLFKVPKGSPIALMITFAVAKTAIGGTGSLVLASGNNFPVMADFGSFGIIGDGTSNNQRVNNQVYRFELEETGDNTGVFTGTNQYVMANQVNIFDPGVESSLRVINHDVKFAAIQDMLQSEARAPQVTYLDLGQDGVDTQQSAQVDVPTHTGVVSFDSKTYKIADTVTITLNDQDLNIDSDLVDIYTAVAPVGAPGNVQDVTTDTIGTSRIHNLNYTDGTAFGRLLDVQFGQQTIRWSNSLIDGQTNNNGACFGPAPLGADSNAGTAGGFATSLSATGFSLVETGPATGVFTGTFEIPDQLCQNSQIISTVGQNIKVNYVDFRDDSGKLIEVSDNAGVRGNTGSVKLDKAVYPVPFGTIGATVGVANFDPAPSKTSENGVFPLHRDIVGKSVAQGGGLISSNVLPTGIVLVHIRVNDRDFDTSATGTDHIAVSGADANHGPVAVQITRQGNSMLLATAGAPAIKGGKIVNINGTQLPAVGDHSYSQVPDLGPMTEIAPDAGIFQADLPIELTDGPAGTDCPIVQNFDGAINGTTFNPSQSVRFYSTPGASGQSGNYCVRQGDVMTVTYRDQNDASGNPQTVTDSSTFDLRNGVLQSDKSVYIIGSDMILTLVEPDFNLDSQQSETATLDLIEWDSHAFKNTMGPLGGQISAFDPKPNTFVETGKDTGIFQSVIKIPKQLNSNLLERGEQIHLEYTDWGPAGSKTVGGNNQDIELTIYTSNFGATVELDQKVYTWTDRVYTTVVAPDHNFDPNLIDTIGTNDENKVTVSTRGNSINQYQLVETGVDTGIFTGYVILTGDPNVKGPSGVDGSGLNPTGIGPTGTGPTGGFLPSEESDGVSVSFEFTRDQTVTGSALIRWNIGETKWLEASYPANGQGVLQIVDPDMNLNPKAVDKFDTNVWSDSDSGGIKLTMTETGEATGIFQGTVYFTTNFQSSGNRLHVAEGDTVTGEYKDRTLPAPYTPSDQLRLTTTTFIGTIVPPLERAPAANPRIVDSFGNAISGSVKVGQQIQITADLTNGQDRDQPFAYIVQVQDGNGVTVSLSWITGTLTAGQSLNPAQSWTPGAAGSYTAQIFVWQSIDNPNALSPPLSTTINVA